MESVYEGSPTLRTALKGREPIPAVMEMSTPIRFPMSIVVSDARGRPARALRAPVKLILATLFLMLAAAATPGFSQAKAQENLPVLTHAAEIRKLTVEQALRSYPVDLRGVMTYNVPAWGVAFFQDSTAGIFLWMCPANAHAGDLVEVRGRTVPGGFAPSVQSADIRVVGKAPFPPAHRFPVDDLLTGRQDSQWVEVTGVVRSVAIDPPVLNLGIAVGSTKFRARISEFKRDADYASLIDAEVAIRGACGALFNDKRQLIGIQLWVPSLEQIHIEQAAPSDPYALPIVPTSSLMQFTPERAVGHRLRVQGVVTLDRPGQFISVQDASGGVLVLSHQSTPVRPGDRVDAVGFPSAGRYAPVLEDGEFRKIGHGTLPKPVDLTRPATLSGDQDAELVKIQGRLLDQSLQGEDVVLTMQTGGFTFTAHLEKAHADHWVRGIPVGSLLETTGVLTTETDEYRTTNQRPADNVVAQMTFRMLLRSAGDIVVVEKPSWWTKGRIAGLLAIFGAIILWISGWVGILRKRVDVRTETIRATLESTADGILVVNSAGKIAAYNRKFADMWRIPESVLESRDENQALDFVLSQLKDSDAFLTKVRQTYADHDARTDDVIEFKDGRVFERHSEPQRVQSKSVGRVWGFRDSTERRRAEEALRESEERYRLLFENNLAGVFRGTLRDRRVLDCNDAYARILGYDSRQEVLNCGRLHDFYEPAQLESLRNRLLKEKALTSFEALVGRKDGTRVWVLENVSLLDEREGKEPVVEGTLIDITERKQAEQALAQERDLLCTLMDNVPDHIYFKDRQSRFLRINVAHAQAFGLSDPSEAVGKTDFDFFTIEHAQKAYNDEQEVIITGKPMIGKEEKGIRPDGRVFWNSTTKMPLRDNAGAIIGTFGVSHDITPSKQMEERLREISSRLQLALKSAKAATWSWNTIDGTLYWDDYVWPLYGLEPRTSPPRYGEFLSAIHPDDREAAQDLVTRSLVEEVPYYSEYRVLWPDGSVHYLASRGDTWRNEEGQVARMTGVTWDVTERKRAEEEVRASRRQLQDIIDFLPDATFVIDRDKKVIAWNRAIEEMTGVRKEDILGQGDYAYALPFYGERRPILVDLLDAEDSELEAKYKYLTKQGSSLYAEVYVPSVFGGRGGHLWATASALLDSQGNRVGGIESIRDITERRRAEEALRESEERYRLLFENNLAGVFRGTLRDRRILDCNDAYARILGYTSRQEVLNCGRLHDFYDPVEHEIVAYCLLREKALASFEACFRRKDGTPIWVLENMRLIEEGEGKEPLVEGTLIDLSERKQAEQALARERDLLRALMDNLPDSIYFKDRQSRFLRISMGLAKAFRLSDPDEAVGKTDFDFFTVEHAQPAYDDEQEVIRTGKPMMAKEEKETWPDGRVTWVSTVKMPFRGANGAIIGTFGVSRDITERRCAEEEVRASRQQLLDIIDFLPDATFVIDRDKKVIAWNRTIEEMTGVRKEDILGQGDYAYALAFYGERRPILVDLLDAEDSEVKAKYKYVTKQGSSLYAEVYVPSVFGGRGGHLWVTASPLLDSQGNWVGGIESIRDITERRHAEEALRESGERYRALFERNLAGVFRGTLHSRRILDCNDAYASILGYDSRQEVLNCGRLHDFYYPVEHEIVTYCLLREKALAGFEACFSRKDGTPIWVLENMSLIEEGEGEEPLVEGTLIDLTERKQVEQALAQERDLLCTLMDNVPDYIYFKDRQSRFLRTNRAHARAFGLSDPSQAMGKTDFDFFTIEHAQPAYDDEQEVIRTGKPMMAKEEKETYPDGRVSWVSTVKIPLRGANGAIIGTFGVSRDITERKRAEEALRTSEERYRELFENASDLVYTTDLEGRLTSLNRVAEQTIGYSREEATQMSLRQLVDPRHWQRVEETRARLLAGDSAVTVELETMTKDGRRVMLEVKPRLIYKDGKPVAVQGIGRDITGREAAEVELRHAQKLESVGRLASGIAHEINTPIQFVGDNTRFLQDSFGGLQILLTKYQELCDAAASRAVSPDLLAEVRRVEEESDCAYVLEEIPKALAQTLDGVTRVATIVRAMKDFAHPESKEKAAADLNKALLSTLTVARNELKYVADVETDFGELPLVVCNIGDLNQVFLNLLVNAAHAIGEVVKATGEKGKIRVRTLAEGETVLITITDTGCGIPEGIRGKIFDPFFTTKEVGRGTGQGLSIARSVVVERHKGSLTFESEVGKGTTFYIRLPVESGECSEETRVA